jgi:biofilm PGA synthesis N-glycosyltransferase PgaC
MSMPKSHNSMSKRTKKLSVVIPARNEEKRLKATLSIYYSFFCQNLDEDFEIIVVCNGCEDNTVQIASEFAAVFPHIKVINLKENGKGLAVIEGFKVAVGEIVGFVDADNATDPPNLWKLVLELSSQEVDGVIGSRNLPDSEVLPKRPLMRRLSSRAFNRLVRILFNLHFRDTQCGAKIFKSYLIPQFVSEVHTRDFAFDVELLMKAVIGGNNIIEVPIAWQGKEGSRLRLIRDTVIMLNSILRLKLLGRSNSTDVHHKPMHSPLEGVADTKSDKLRVSIGICAYNEEGNIAKLLDAIQRQETKRIEISEVIVVSSGCTDKTNELVAAFCRTNSKIVLIQQGERKGKASAVNLFLMRAKQDICILCSADVIPESNSFELLCLPFLDKHIGITGAHPIPSDNANSFMGFAANLVFRLHHKLDRFGELIAFRNLVRSIPVDTAVDEASIEAMIRSKGYLSQYLPNAYVYNKGAGTVADWIRQRRRIHCGHLHLKKTTHYEVSSMNFIRLAKITIGSINFNWKPLVWTTAIIALEIYCRLLGSYDFYLRHKNPYIWEIASSTKVVNECKQDQE